MLNERADPLRMSREKKHVLPPSGFIEVFWGVVGNDGMIVGVKRA